MKTFTRLPAVTSRVKPWALVAVILTVLLMGYYGFLGVRYWNASREATALSGEVRRISALLRGKTATEDPLQELAAREERVKELEAFYDYPESDDLLAIIAAAGRDASVKVTSMAVGDPRPAKEGGIQYQSQPVMLTLQGNVVEVERFLSLLHERTPVVAVSSMRLAGLQSAPSTQVNLLFYLSPQPAAAPKQATALTR